KRLRASDHSGITARFLDHNTDFQSASRRTYYPDS
ncbi:uncharacterized protein METZ01_LOCUS440438, partial [marine metagenome]